MTLVSSWLLGLLAIASILMCACLWPVVRAEFRATDVRWYQNRALWLSSALCVHPLGALFMLVATITTGVDDKKSAILFLLWGGWGLWLVAKTMVIAVSGRLQLALGLYALWTLFVVAWRLG